MTRELSPRPDEYGANGLRKSKTVNGTATGFVWNEGSLAAELEGSNITNMYNYGADGIESKTTGTAAALYLKDSHGNITGATDTNGNVSDSSYLYDAFGNVLSTDTPDPLGYCGEYLDIETGLIYLRNRYYDSSTGRFITEDPAKDGVNWYIYCAGNPVTAVDPLGLTHITGGTVQLSLNGYDIDTSKTHINDNDPVHYSITNEYITIDLGADDVLQFNILDDFPHVCQDVYIKKSSTCWAASAQACLEFLGIEDADQKHIAESYYYDKVPIDQHVGEYYNRGVANAAMIAEAIDKSGYLRDTNYIAVSNNKGLNGMVEVINNIDNNLPFIGFPRDSHIEAAIGYISAPNAGIDFVVCEDSSQTAEDMYPREIFDISKIAPKPVTIFQRR